MNRDRLNLLMLAVLIVLVALLAFGVFDGNLSVSW